MSEDRQSFLAKKSIRLTPCVPDGTLKSAKLNASVLLFQQSLRKRQLGLQGSSLPDVNRNGLW